MRPVIFICFFTILASAGCDAGNGRNAVGSGCKPYFNFNAVDHYSTEANDGQLMALEGKAAKTGNEILLLGLLVNDTLDKLSDTAVLMELDNLGFQKRKVPAVRFDKLKEIFCERKHEELLATSCIAIYRDILVFRQNEKITGMAKICFDCNKSIISGTHQNTQGFGQSGDYEKLQKLLNEQGHVE